MLQLYQRGSLGNKAFGSIFDSVMDNRVLASRPRIRVEDKKEEYEILVELPGVDKSDISLTYQDSVLTLKAEKKEVESNEKVLINEIRSVLFERSMTIEGVDADGIDANLKNGILTIKLPKAAEIKPKMIKIG